MAKQGPRNGELATDDNRFTTLWTEHDLGRDEATWQRLREAESCFAEDAGRLKEQNRALQKRVTELEKGGEGSP